MERRGFLTRLASLPFVGGGVALIGQPTSAAVPITLPLVEAYLGWLRLEHTKLMHEIVDRPLFGNGYSWQSHSPALALPESPDLIRVVAAGTAAARAPVMLSAAGVDWREADTSACADLAERARSGREYFDPFGDHRLSDKEREAYRERVFARAMDPRDWRTHPGG